VSRRARYLVCCYCCTCLSFNYPLIPQMLVCPTPSPPRGIFLVHSILLTAEARGSKGMINEGVEPATLALLAPRSNQLS
jgi:hypothetical protein